MRSHLRVIAYSCFDGKAFVPHRFAALDGRFVLPEAIAVIGAIPRRILWPKKNAIARASALGASVSRFSFGCCNLCE